METYYIYTLEDPITNEIRYVGYTKTTLSRRLKSHLKNVVEAESKTRKWNKRLSWIKSVGIPIIIELDSCTTKEEAYQLECYWISQLLQWGFNLTNMTSGGDGGNTFSMLSTEDKQLVRDKLSRNALGRTRTETQISSWRESVKTNGHWLSKPNAIHPMKGKYHSKETKLKLSKASSGRLFSEESKLRLKGRTPFNKGISKYPSVVRIDEQNCVEVFDTISLAIAYLGLPNNRQSDIVRCCKGKTKKAFGYIWKFKDYGIVQPILKGIG